MPTSQERIKWPPRIRPEFIERLYQSDARGLQDADLCSEKPNHGKTTGNPAEKWSSVP